jgi:hypothetical protein
MKIKRAIFTFFVVSLVLISCVNSKVVSESSSSSIEQTRLQNDSITPQDKKITTQMKKNSVRSLEVKKNYKEQNIIDSIQKK